MGIIFDIKRFALHDGPGIRTTVFFKGCPLRCWWCQNPESIRSLPEKLKTNTLSASYNKSCEEEIFGRDYTVEEVMNEVHKDRIFYDESGGGVTFSGGEPMMQNNFLKELLINCKNNDIQTAVDTSGYFPSRFIDGIYDFTDLFLFDIKLIDDELHKKFTDVSNKLILENIKHLTNLGEKVILRIPLIPGITDTQENLVAISSVASTLKNIKRIDLLPYNEIVESKYKRLNKPSSLRALKSQSETELNNIKSVFNKLEVEISIRG